MIRVTINGNKMPLNIENPSYDIISVRYLVSSDSTFLDNTKVIQDVTKLKEDITMMSFNFPYSFPDKKPIYGKLFYKYQNNIIEESSVCRLEYDQPGFSFNNNIISTPMVTIVGNTNYNNMNTGDFTLETSDFQMHTGHGELKSVSWIITDLEDNVILESPKDDFNLKTFYVEKDVLEENKAYKAKVIHHNNYSSDSYPGVLGFSTYNADNKFSIVKDSIELCNNNISKIKTVVNLFGFKHILIDILDKTGEAILENFISTTKDINIPKIGMVEGERYTISLTAKYTNHYGEYVFTKPLIVNSICKSCSGEAEYYPDYKYSNVFEIVNYDFKDSFIGDTNLIKGVAKQLSNGDIPVYKVLDVNNIEIRFYKFIDNKFIYTNRSFKLNTDSTIELNSGVNIFLAIDKLNGDYRLVVSYNVATNKIEFMSYKYMDGQYGNISLVDAPNKLTIDNNRVLVNSTPNIMLNDDSFLSGVINKLAGDKKNILSIKDNASSMAYVSNLYINSSVINNSISMFNLPDSKVLVIHSDITPSVYGVYDKTNNVYTDLGLLPTAMQNLANDVNKNYWNGYTKLDGRVMMYPNVNTNIYTNLSVWEYDPYLNTFSKIINNSSIAIPSKYTEDGNDTLGGIYTVELLNGESIFLTSGNGVASGNYMDIWKFY